LNIKNLLKKIEVIVSESLLSSLKISVMIIDRFKIKNLRWQSDENLLYQLENRVLNKNISFKYGRNGKIIDGVVNNVEIAKSNTGDFKCIVFKIYDGIDNSSYACPVNDDILVYDYNLICKIDPYGEENWEDRRWRKLINGYTED
jgi:hypothetical protein